MCHTKFSLYDLENQTLLVFYNPSANFEIESSLQKLLIGNQKCDSAT